MAKERSKQLQSRTKNKIGQEEILSRPENDDQTSLEDDVEVWDLQHAYTAKQRAATCRKMCMAESCDNVAVAAWASSKDPENYWDACEDCQVQEFGGWPQDFVFPSGFETDDASISNLEHKASVFSLVEVSSNETVADTTEKGCEEYEQKADIPILSNEDDPGLSSENEDETEVWDLQHVYTAKQRAVTCRKMCMADNCTNVAVAAWASSKDPENYWDACEDCQIQEFGGWPEDFEFPPGFETYDDDDDEFDLQNTEMHRANPTTDNRGRKKSKSATQITPPPNSLTAITKVPPAVKNNASKSSAFISPLPTNKPSAAALAMHKKWQEAAESMHGGLKDVRIVLSKPNAKKLIYDLLREEFAPMNITDIYKKLKAVVPSPILSACLDDMIFLSNDSTEDNGHDSDDDVKKTKKIMASDSGSDPFVATVLLKEGRKASSNLYFIDQSKLENNGNGLLAEDRDKLLISMHQASEEELDLQTKVNEILSKAIALETEPTNEDADQLLQLQMDRHDELESDLAKCRLYPANSKLRKEVNKKIEILATHWRQRKRMCMDFLRQMEECTDGAVSVKKCLTGDGAIELDSDEIIVKSAVEYGEKKKKQKTFHSNNKESSTPLPDKNFVAILLEPSGLYDVLF